MTKGWLTAALIAIWLGYPVVARAQYLPPSGGPPPLAEPMPLSGPAAPPGQAAPPLVPGCPPLTESAVTIGGDTPNAFHKSDEQASSCQKFGEGNAWYMSLGTLGLKRDSLNSRTLAVLDPQRIDTGNPPPPGAPSVLNSQIISPNSNWGVSTTLGCRWDGNAIELSGFYLPQATAAFGVDQRGGLDLPFFNPPLGFEGDNGLWRQADRVLLTHTSALGSLELNYRREPVSGYGLELIAGVRYLDLLERYGILTDDDGLTVIPVDPFRIANYEVKTHNRIVAAQLGLEWEYPLRPWLALGITAKGAWGANFLDSDVTLTRGDLFQGFSGHRSKTVFSHLYQLGLYSDFYFSDRMRLRTGYQFMWVLGLAEAADQLDFDLSHNVGNPNDNGSVFYHGPVIEFHVLF